MASICTSLRRLGFEGEAGLGEEPVDEGGPVLDALEPGTDGLGDPVSAVASLGAYRG